MALRAMQCCLLLCLMALCSSCSVPALAQAAGVEMLRAILAPILLRRTKASLIDGQHIVTLPPRHGRPWRHPGVEGPGIGAHS